MANLSPNQKTAIEFPEHIALTANAGSGKTFVLAKRYVEVALTKSIPLSKIVAITFTDKAAGELYTRIVKEIEERIISEEEESEIKKLKRIRRQIISANISTIHSFCVDLLKEYAPYANLDLNFAPIDARYAEELKVQSFDNVISKLLNENNAEIKDLIRYFGSKVIFVREMSKLFNKRKSLEKFLNDFNSETPEEIAEEWEKLFVDKFNNHFLHDLENIFHLTRIINESVLSVKPENQMGLDIQAILSRIKEPAADNLFENLILLESLKSTFLTKKLTVKKSGYLNKELQSNLRREVEALEGIISKLSFLSFTENYREIELKLAALIKKVLTIFNELNKEYAKLKNRFGYLDFEDILLFARKILSLDEVREELKGKFDYIMVDEYQDTNEIQYDIVLPLIEEFKRGNLFIVGDEKQSIYMFREADLKIFNKTKEQISELTRSRGILNLPHSFRLDPYPALFINYLFGKLFKNADKEFNEVEADDLICAKKYKSNGKVGLLINKDPERSEGDLLARKILLLKSSGRKLSEITVLCRKREFFNELAEFFNEYNIPYTIIGSKGFYRNPPIVDFQNYLSFLINNNDDSALLEILRSPFFYLPDTVIYEARRSYGKSFYERLQNYAKTNNSVRAVIEILNSHINLARSLSISELLVDIINSTQILRVISDRPHSERAFATIDKLIDLAIKFQTEPFATLYDFVEYLKTAIEKDSDESQAELFSESEKVKIMTVHQSKGLEFPVVILYKTNSQLNIDRVEAKSLLIDNEFGIVTKVPGGDTYFSDFQITPHGALLNYYIKRKQLAEEKRLLYVAFTRAEEELYISADISGKKSQLTLFNEIAKAIDFNEDDKRLRISNIMRFMDVENNFKLEEKNLTIDIEIENELPLEELSELDAAKEDNEKIILAGEISDKEKNEIYSATKIAVFKQCPLKYNLIYNYGLSKLQSKLYLPENYEFNPSENEESENIPPNITGSLIHKILEKNITPENIADFLNKEVQGYLYDAVQIEKTVDEISEMISKFYSSEIFGELNKYGNFKNEYEIYLRRENYFLYGIIDKVIFEDGKVQIVDYKTDKLGKLTPDDKFAGYEIQLKFYAYLVSKITEGLKEIELKLCFVRYPDKSISKVYGLDEINHFESEVNEIIKNISNGNFGKELSHCVKCQFSDGSNNCIIKE